MAASDTSPRRASRLADLAAPLAVLLVTLVLAASGLNRDAISRGDDIIFHSTCANGFAESLREGVLYPRWLANANRGFGAPVFLFYPPVGNFMMGGATLLLGDLFEALRWTPAFALLLSGLACWVALRRHLSPLATAIGSCLYVVLPYHVLDLFWRYAWGELVGFIWLPLLLVSALEVVTAPTRRSWFVLTVSALGLLLSHLPTVVIAPLVLGPILALQLLRTRRFRSLAALVAAAVVAGLCAGGHLLPLMRHMPDIHLEWTRGEEYDFRRHFVFRDEEAFGFEFDETKPEVERAVWTEGVLALAAIGVLAATHRRRPRAESDQDADQPAVIDPWMVAGLTVWTVFLQTALSSPLWSHVPVLASVQFPWRFAVYQVLMTAILAALAIDRAPAAARWRWTGLIVALAIPALWASATMIPDKRSFDRAYMESEDYHDEMVREYIPQAVDGWRWLRDIEIPPQVSIRRGSFEVIDWRSHERRVRIDAVVGQRVWVNTFAFPGWEVSVDGVAVELLDDWRISFPLTQGVHDVEVRFVTTPIRRAGAWCSALGLGILLTAAVVAWRRRSAPGMAP